MNTTTRRDLLKGLAFGSLIIGFDPLNRSWVTSANAAGAAKLDHLPHLDGVLRTDDEALTAASGDFGVFVNRRPVAVLEPGSVLDIARVVRFANKHDLRIAVRGHGHSIYGQTLVKGGIVIQMSTLAKGAQSAGRACPRRRRLLVGRCARGDVEGGRNAARHSRLSRAQRWRNVVDRRHQPDHLSLRRTGRQCRSAAGRDGRRSDRDLLEASSSRSVRCGARGPGSVRGARACSDQTGRCACASPSVLACSIRM